MAQTETRRRARAGPPNRRCRWPGLLRTPAGPVNRRTILVFAAPGATPACSTTPALGDAMVAFVAFCLAASGTSSSTTPATATPAPAPTKVPPPDRRRRGVADPRLRDGRRPDPRRRGRGVRAHWRLAVTVAAYVALTTSYGFWLKHIAVVDLVAIAAGFVLRAIGGATATSVPISNWFFIVASFGSLFIVAGKRSGEMGELAGDAGTIRPTLEVCTTSYLAYLRSVSSGVMLVA